MHPTASVRGIGSFPRSDLAGAIGFQVEHATTTLEAGWLVAGRHDVCGIPFWREHLDRISLRPAPSLQELLDKVDGSPHHRGENTWIKINLQLAPSLARAPGQGLSPARTILAIAL